MIPSLISLVNVLQNKATLPQLLIAFNQFHLTLGMIPTYKSCDFIQGGIVIVRMWSLYHTVDIL